MRRSRVYSKDEREWIMSEYLRLKRSTGWNNERLARHLGVNPSTIYSWKDTEWYAELSRKVNWQENTEITTGALDKLDKLIQSDDAEVALKALAVFVRLNPDIRLNKNPYRDDEETSNVNVFNSDQFLRHRYGDDDDE